jgi:hypothetical protein
VLQEDRLAFARRYLSNALDELRLWFTSASFLTALWIGPFFIGLWQLRWRRALFLLPLFIPLAMIPASVVDPRYFLIPLPIAMIFTAAGLLWLRDKLPLVGRNILLGDLLVGGLLAVFAAASVIGPFLYPRPVEYRAAGLALRAEIPPGSRILARKRQLPYYAGGVYEWLPLAELPDVLAHARTRGISYLLVDRYTTPSLRPQLGFLLDPAQAPPVLQPVYVSPNVVVYQIDGGD